MSLEKEARPRLITLTEDPADGDGATEKRLLVHYFLDQFTPFHLIVKYTLRHLMSGYCVRYVQFTDTDHSTREGAFRLIVAAPSASGPELMLIRPDGSKDEDKKKIYDEMLEWPEGQLVDVQLIAKQDEFNDFYRWVTKGKNPFPNHFRRKQLVVLDLFLSMVTHKALLESTNAQIDRALEDKDKERFLQLCQERSEHEEALKKFSFQTGVRSF